MSIQIADAALLFSLFTAVFAVIASFITARNKTKCWHRSSNRAVFLTFLYQSIAVGLMISCLINRSYHIDYVYQTVDNSMSVWLRIAALWGKQSGSLLFWSWLLSLFALILTRTLKDQPERSGAITFLMANLSFFICINFTAENPFLRLWADTNTGNVYKSIAPLSGMLAHFPENGLGMNPLLRHFGMVLHPPALYLGYIGVFVPVSLQIEEVFRKQPAKQWLKDTRSWYLFAWIFLAIGLLLGSRWAYDVLGWGGYWGWDPVEVSALIPFLLLTASIHAVIGNKVTGKFRIPISILGPISAFSIVFSTFVTRSGLIQSVHAFSVSPVSGSLAVYMLVFLAFTLAVILKSQPKGENAADDPSLSFRTFLQTRTFIFYSLITLFSVISFFCLWGILLPTVMNLISGTAIAVDASFYTQSTGPLFLLMLIALGIYPMTGWKQGISSSNMLAIGVLAAISLAPVIILRRTDPLDFLQSAAVWAVCFGLLTLITDWLKRAFVHKEQHHQFKPARLISQFAQPRTRLTEVLLHLGVLLMALGIIGIEFFQQEGQLNLTLGETKYFQGYQITLETYDMTAIPEGTLTESRLLVAAPDGEQFTVQPARKFYQVYGQETTLPGINSRVMADFYAILMSSSVNEDNDAHLFTFFINPLINFLWVGGWILCLGGVIALVMPALSRRRKND